MASMSALSVSSSSASANLNEESPVQRQARLRRERREAKLKNEGNARLDRINQIAGRSQQHENETSLPADQAILKVSAGGLHTAGLDDEQDPPDVDLRTLLPAHDPAELPSNPFGTLDGDGPHAGFPRAEDDPLMKMLSQLLGDPAAGATADPMGRGELPPGLAAMSGLDTKMFGATVPGAMGSTSIAGLQSEGLKKMWLWKITHALVALTLGLYFTGQLDFALRRATWTSSRIQRDGGNVFWTFVTVELLLQTTRYFLERGKPETRITGIYGMLTNFLPSPWRDYLMLAARYSNIWTTLIEDSMVLIFTIGLNVQS